MRRVIIIIVNDVKYFDISLGRDFVAKVLRHNGLCIADEDYLPLPPRDCGNSEGFLFFAARKCV